MRMELQVCQRVKYQYLQSYEYKLVKHGERYVYQNHQKMDLYE